MFIFLEESLPANLGHNFYKLFVQHPCINKYIIRVYKVNITPPPGQTGHRNKQILISNNEKSSWQIISINAEMKPNL